MLNFSLIVTVAAAVSVIAMGVVFIRKLGRVQRALDGIVATAATLPPLRRDGGAR